MADNEVGSLHYDLDLDDSKFKSKLKSSEQAASVFGNKAGAALEGIGKAALGLGVAAAGAFAGFAALSVKAANESQEKLAQLDAVLKSTGQQAGVTRDAAIELSKGLQKVTTFSDESVLSVENLLLTFTNITKDKFPDATKTVLDMATALGEDTKEAAIQVGKALQDPILGITALRRVGVNFTDAQKEVIKKLVETGQSAKAQELILKELHKEFGGSAEAATQTFGGALKQLGNSVNDLQETFGLAIIQGITPFVKSLAAWATSTQGQEFIKGLIAAFQILLATLIQVGGAVFQLTGFFMQHKEVLVGLAAFVGTILVAAFVSWAAAAIPAAVATLIALAPILIVAAAIGVAVGVLYLVWTKNFLGIRDVTASVAKAISSIFGTIINDFKHMVNFVIDGLNGLIRGFDKLPAQVRLGVTIPQIPRFAKGVTNFSGGIATVGEQGPETVYLPKGSSVIPNGKSISTNTNIYGDINIGSEVQADTFLRRLTRNRELASLGLATVGSEQ